MREIFKATVIAAIATMLLANCTKSDFDSTEVSLQGQNAKDTGNTISAVNTGEIENLECHADGTIQGVYWKAAIIISSGSGVVTQKGALAIEGNLYQEINLDSDKVELIVDNGAGSARAVNNDQTASTAIVTDGKSYRMMIQLIGQVAARTSQIPQNLIYVDAECTSGLTSPVPAPQPLPPTDPRLLPPQDPTCHNTYNYQPIPTPETLKSRLPSCNYPVFPVAQFPTSECSASGTNYSPIRQQTTADGARYEFSMYNATNYSHASFVTAQFGLTGDRYLTYQNVELSGNLKPNSVDLVLSSYEPVEWRIIGNVGAVRSVHVSGYHCALVTGVDESIVELSTYEQGDYSNSLLPLSRNFGGGMSVYEGSCLPNRTFSAQ